MDTPTLLAHLHHHDTALSLPRGACLRWDDADLHRAAHTGDPEGYALLGLAPGVRPWQRARVLLQILAASQAGLDDRARAVQARVARVLTLGLPPAHVITVLLALRRLRANHKHTTRTALRFVLEHPAADALIAARRPALRDCFEHALGAATARGCAGRIAGGDTASDYLQRRLLRFLTDPAAAPARVQALYDAGKAAAATPGGDHTAVGEPVLPVDTARGGPPPSPPPTVATSPPPSSTSTGAGRPKTSTPPSAATSAPPPRRSPASPAPSRSSWTPRRPCAATATANGPRCPRSPRCAWCCRRCAPGWRSSRPAATNALPAAPPTSPPASWTPWAPAPTWSPSSPTATRTSSPATWPGSWRACPAPASPPPWCSATPCSPAATT
ncbi:hypothetical protein ACFQY7_11695 [Actinomadura luteofluorescens]|uniref:hypothetical protein n=1 Tax=Actinomadura luteofluorescens TaxID=46163 RepID=UPI00362C82A5